MKEIPDRLVSSPEFGKAIKKARRPISRRGWLINNRIQGVPPIPFHEFHPFDYRSIVCHSVTRSIREGFNPEALINGIPPPPSPVPGGPLACGRVRDSNLIPVPQYSRGDLWRVHSFIKILFKFRMSRRWRRWGERGRSRGEGDAWGPCVSPKSHRRSLSRSLITLVSQVQASWTYAFYSLRNWGSKVRRSPEWNEWPAVASFFFFFSKKKKKKRELPFTFFLRGDD